MTIDVRTFAQVNAIDTCAIWNVLSSPKLVSAALAKQCWFVVADYIRYEALVRPRTNPEASELELQAKFRDHLQKNHGFFSQSVNLADLQAVANMPAIRRLGRGEIAAIALARRLRISFMTDDQQARAKARCVDDRPVNTTPHLLGWLTFDGALNDSDFGIIVAEHEASIPRQRGQLTKFFKVTYEEACRCRLAGTHAP